MFTGGLFLFLAIFLMAFWLLLFLSAIALPYALTVYVLNLMKKNKTVQGETSEEAAA